VSTLASSHSTTTRGHDLSFTGRDCLAVRLKCYLH
jgi:hypothetical protein